MPPVPKTPRQRAIGYLQTIYWILEVVRVAGVARATDLPARVKAFVDTEPSHFARYAQGTSPADGDWISRVDREYPGTAGYFSAGPKGIFGAILGSAGDRRRFLERLLGFDSAALVKSEADAECSLFSPELAEARMRLLFGTSDVDAFFAATIFHLGAFKQFWYVGRDFYAAYEALDQFAGRNKTERAIRENWYRFLDATLVEADPFGHDDRFRFPPQICVTDQHLAGPRARAAIRVAYSTPGIPMVRVVDEYYWANWARARSKRRP